MRFLRLAAVLSLFTLLLAPDLSGSILVYKWIRIGDQQAYQTDSMYVASTSIRVQGYLIFEYIPDLKTYNNPTLVQYWGTKKSQQMMVKSFLQGTGTFREITFAGKPLLMISCMNTSNALNVLATFYNGEMKLMTAKELGTDDSETLAKTLVGNEIWDGLVDNTLYNSGSGNVTLTMDLSFTNNANVSELNVDETVQFVVNSLATKGYKDVSPIAFNETVTGKMNTALTIDVLANCYDPQGQSMSIQDIVSYPAHGNANVVYDEALKRDVISYVPNTAWTGTDTFIYQIVNTAGGIAKATVTVIIQ